MEKPLIAVAGASGEMGGRISRALLRQGAHVRGMVRSRGDATRALEQAGVSLVDVNYDDAASLRAGCEGAQCVVSTLNGLRDVIVDAQSNLVEAAVAAKVPRFIPSDYALDFTGLPMGTNRNLDLRREFLKRVEGKAIQVTSVLNGAFMELLAGQAPFLMPKIKRALVWGSADQKLDFTTMDDLAEVTARAALDASSPRFVRVAGDSLSARELAEVAERLTGQRYKLLRAGSVKRLRRIIWVMRKLMRNEDEVFPPWQGMQYMADMFEGRGKLEPLDNDRFKDVRFTRVEEFLKAHPALKA